MSRVIETTVYNFGELSEEAKTNALESMRDTNVDMNDWFDSTYENFIEEMKQIGFNLTSKDLSFRGFNSQGDGASFVCDSIDLDKLTKFIDKENETDLGKYVRFDQYFSMDVYRSHHQYAHERTVTVRYDCHGGVYPLVSDKFNAFEELVSELVVSKSQKLYRDLEAEHTHLTSDESVKETIEANNYEFDDEGNQY